MLKKEADKSQFPMHPSILVSATFCAARGILFRIGRALACMLIAVSLKRIFPTVSATHLYRRCTEERVIKILVDVDDCVLPLRRLFSSLVLGGTQTGMVISRLGISLCRRLLFCTVGSSFCTRMHEVLVSGRGFL